jgi:hypothetical protein
MVVVLSMSKLAHQSSQTAASPAILLQVRCFVDMNGCVLIREQAMVVLSMSVAPQAFRTASLPATLRVRAS